MRRPDKHEDPARGQEAEKLALSLPEERRADVRHDGVEGGRPKRGPAVTSNEVHRGPVELGVTDGRLHALRIDVHAYRQPSAEPQAGDGQDARARAHVEQAAQAPSRARAWPGPSGTAVWSRGCRFRRHDRGRRRGPGRDPGERPTRERPRKDRPRNRGSGRGSARPNRPRGSRPPPPRRPAPPQAPRGGRRRSRDRQSRRGAGRGRSRPGPRHPPAPSPRGGQSQVFVFVGHPHAEGLHRGFVGRGASHVSRGCPSSGRRGCGPSRGARPREGSWRAAP